MTMSLLESLFPQGTTERLGWMLVHVLWQATAVAILLAVFLRRLRRASANVRYWIACSALALMVALPIVTIRLIQVPGPAAEAGPPPAIVTLPPETTAPEVQAIVEAAKEIPAVAQPPTPLQTAKQITPVPLRERIVSMLEPALPCVVLGWLVGVFGLSAWHLGGWTQLQRLKHRVVRQIGDPLQQRLEELSHRLGVHRAVGLLESALVEVPTVVGWLRPVILLPASALTGLSIEQLEAILAHELAHIRRYDYLANIVQTVVEILGFYHPAVWWVSRRIRIERENCCDDLAVHVCGSSLKYAKALACMEEIRHNGSELAVAATGGSLMARIARLLGRPAADDRRFAWLPGLVALLLVVGIIFPAALVLGTPQPPQTAEPAAVATTRGAAEPNAAPASTESASGSPSDEVAQILLDFKIIRVLDDLRPDRALLHQMAQALGDQSPLARVLRQPGRELDMTLDEVFKRYIVPQSLSEQGFEAMMHLLRSHSGTTMLASPRVLAHDGKQVQMRVVDNVSLPALSDSSSAPQAVECGTAITLTGHVLDRERLTLEIMAEISNIVSRDSNEMVISRSSAETSVTAWNDRYLAWAAVVPTMAGPGTNRQSVYIMVRPHINLPPQGLANAVEERRPDGTPPRQVLLNVRTVTAGHDALSALGIEWRQPSTKAGVSPDHTPQTSPTAPSSGPRGVQIGYAPDLPSTDSLLAALDLLQKNWQAEISSQQILTQERHRSQIKALKEEWTTVAAPATPSSPQAHTQPYKTETGTVVTVKPHVADNDTILLELTIDTTGSLPRTQGSDLPMQTKQTCQTTITLKDGGTVVIGGLSVNGAQGQPGQETVIFVTTHLLPDRKETPVGTPQAAGPDTRVTPPASLTPEQIASMRREYVNSDPMVSELSKSIVAMERDLITQQALVKEHPRLSQEQAALVDLKDKLVSRRRELEKEFDDGLTARTGGSLGDRTEDRKRTTITATFTNTDLRDVLSEIAQRAGVKITPDATVKATPVTTELADASADAALRQVLKNTPYIFRNIGNGDYSVFRPQTLSFTGANLVQALQDLATSAEVPIIVDPNVRGDVSASFENVPLEDALRLMLAGKPLVFKKAPSYYLVAGRSLTSQPISETRRIRLNYVQPARVKQLLAPVCAPYVQIERPNPRDPNDQGNVLLVTAAPAVADRIVADIKQIDHPKKQVLLDARVVSMEKGNLLKLGSQWNWPTIQAGASTSPGITNSTGTTTSVQFGYAPDQTFTDSLLTALHLLEENKQADIIANPKVVALDGRRAEMKVIEEQWFMMTGSVTDADGHTRTNLQKIESGTVLTITPYIGDNNDIMLQMAAEVTDSIPKARGSDLPLVTRRMAKNTVTVKDGGTVAIAGLTENRSGMGERRVPFLSDIPLLGELFKNRNNDKSTREVAVFVTVHLVPDTDRATLQPPAALVETKARVQNASHSTKVEQTSAGARGTAVPVELRSVGSSEEMRKARELQEKMDSDLLSHEMKNDTAEYQNATPAIHTLMDRVSQVQRGLYFLQQTLPSTHPAVLEKKALLAVLRKKLDEKPTQLESEFWDGVRARHIIFDGTLVSIRADEKFDAETAKQAFALVAQADDAARASLSLEELRASTAQAILQRLATHLPAKLFRALLKLLESKGFVRSIAEPVVCLQEGWLAKMDVPMSSIHVTLNVLGEVLASEQAVLLDIQATVKLTEPVPPPAGTTWDQASPPHCVRTLAWAGISMIPNERHAVLQLDAPTPGADGSREVYCLIVNPTIVESPPPAESVGSPG